MKIAIITDLHFGARQDSIAVAANQELFYNNLFFPYIQQHMDIDQVLCLGDVFDRRKYTNHWTLYNAKKVLFDRLNACALKTTILVGNHDMYYRATNSINTLDLFLREYPNITIIDRPTELFDGKILALPWICEENVTESLQKIKETNAAICVAHLELSGFEMYRGLQIDRGMNPALFSKFDMVLSGHFHHRSQRNNIYYLGSPFEITWADYNDQRGFHVLDTSTRDLEFVVNPHRLFEMITYDDNGAVDYNDVALPPERLAELNQRYVKISVVNKSNLFFFDKFVKDLELAGPISVQINDKYEMDNVDNQSDTSYGAVDSLEYLMNCVAEYTDTMDADKRNHLKRVIAELYQSASAVVEE